MFMLSKICIPINGWDPATSLNQTLQQRDQLLASESMQKTESFHWRTSLLFQPTIYIVESNNMLYHQKSKASEDNNFEGKKKSIFTHLRKPIFSSKNNAHRLWRPRQVQEVSIQKPEHNIRYTTLHNSLGLHFTQRKAKPNQTKHQSNL